MNHDRIIGSGEILFVPDVLVDLLLRKNLAAAACEKMEDGKLLVRQRNTLAGLCNGMMEQIDFDIVDRNVLAFRIRFFLPFIDAVPA